MRTIVLYGHPDAGQTAYTHVDAALRDRNVVDIVLVQTDWPVDEQVAQSIRTHTTELWYCGAQLLPPDGVEQQRVFADRFLLGATFEEIGRKAIEALNGFLEKHAVVSA